MQIKKVPTEKLRLVLVTRVLDHSLQLRVAKRMLKDIGKKKLYKRRTHENSTKTLKNLRWLTGKKNTNFEKYKTDNGSSCEKHY